MLVRFCFFLVFMFSALGAGADDRASEVAKALANLEHQKLTVPAPALVPAPPSPVTPTTVPSSTQPSAWEERHQTEPYITLLSEYETKILPDWSYEETYHVRLKIQKEEARQLGQWPIYYNKSREEITDIKAFVETPDGKRLDNTNVSEAQDYPDLVLYSDMKIKVITMPQVTVGSVLDVTVTTKGRKEIPNEFWQQIPYPAIPTKYSRHTYIFSEKQDLQFKSYKIERQPLVEKKDGMVKYSFIFEQTDGFQPQEMMPPLEDVMGNLYVGSVKDWKTVADWYRAWTEKNITDDQEMAAKAAELAKNTLTQKDKARAVLEFIQDNLRYVAMDFGDHWVEPHDPVDILKAGYGDSKDIAVLARQMLKSAGIESNMCLMAAEFAGNPQNALPNPAVFQHVMLEMTLDGQKYFVDPQLKGFDFGQHPSCYDNAYVFVIDKNGYRFDQLLTAPEDQHTLITQSEITVTPEGAATFDVHVVLPLESSQSFRKQWAALSPEERNKFFDRLQAGYVQGGTLISHEVKGAEARYSPVKMDLKYQSAQAYPVVNDMLILKEAEQSDLPTFAEPERKLPMFMPINSMVKTTNVYRIPEGFKLDFLPKDYKLSVDFFEVEVSYAAGDNNTVTVNSIYRMKRALLPPQRYSEVKQFRAQIDKHNAQYVVLRKKADVAPQAQEWLNKE